MTLGQIVVIETNDQRACVGIVTVENEDILTLDDCLMVHFTMKGDGHMVLSFDKYFPFSKDFAVTFRKSDIRHMFTDIHDTVLTGYNVLIAQYKQSKEILVSGHNENYQSYDDMLDDDDDMLDDDDDMLDDDEMNNNEDIKWIH